MVQPTRQIVPILDALKFRGANREPLRAFTGQEWSQLLELCDRMNLTLPLRRVCGADLPLSVCTRIDDNIRSNEARFARMTQTYAEIANALQSAGIEYVVLKGFAQWPAFMRGPRNRLQSDIDLFSPPESIVAVRDALQRIGYGRIPGGEHLPRGHVPPMTQPTTWQWRGNFYDPEAPLGVDLHWRFWNEAGERIEATGVEQFWHRRVERQWQGLSCPALHPVDAFGYSALHVLHHLVLEGPTPFHVYELAWFLHSHAENRQFWEDWKEMHPSSLRRLQAVSFRLALEWFDCSLPAAIEEEIDCLSPPVKRWFVRYRESPLDASGHPNKHSLWLHLSLLNSARDRIAVFGNVIFPLRMPPAHIAKSRSIGGLAAFGRYALQRIRYHLRLLPVTLVEGWQWWWDGK